MIFSAFRIAVAEVFGGASGAKDVVRSERMNSIGTFPETLSSVSNGIYGE